MENRKAELQDGELEMLPPIEPAVMAHYLAIQDALTITESAIVRRIASALGAGEVRVWFVALSKFSVPDAVAKIRELLFYNTGES
jgi:hypothetical protein